ERLLAVPAVGTADPLMAEAPRKFLGELPARVGSVAVAARIGTRIRRDVRRGEGVGDRDRDAAPVEGGPTFVGRAELRTDIAARRVRKRLSAERRLIRRNLLAVVGRAGRCIPES